MPSGTDLFGNVLGGNMNILDIIQKKRDNIELNNEEIKYFINGYTRYQYREPNKKSNR